MSLGNQITPEERTRKLGDLFNLAEIESPKILEELLEEDNNGKTELIKRVEKLKEKSKQTNK